LLRLPLLKGFFEKQLQVFGVYTQPIPASLFYLSTIGYGADEGGITRAVCAFYAPPTGAGNHHSPIAAVGNLSPPEPAT
jgi:hypothetical protein